MKRCWLIWLSLVPFVFMVAGCTTPFTNKDSTDKAKEVQKMGLVKISKERGSYDRPVWSPDGEKIVFYFEGSIWICDGKGESWRKLTFDGVYKMLDPITWENKNEIYYVDLERGKPFNKSVTIHRLNLLDHSDTVVIQDLSTVTGLSVNPRDTSQLLIATQDENNKYVIHLYDLERNTSKKLVGGIQQRWSPDGKRFSYLSGGINIYDLSTNSSTKIYARKMVQIWENNYQGEMIESLTWSPDGKWIAYRGGPTKDLLGIYIVPSDGSGPPEKILDMGVADLDWSPKGDKIAFTTLGTPERTEMYLMQVPEKYRPKIDVDH